VLRHAIFAATAAAFCASCQDLKEIGGGIGLDLPLLGVVYVCTDGAQTQELCWDSGRDSLEVELDEHGWTSARCSNTNRHLGPCYYQCPSARGCNAFAGCACFGDES
jgi:hypothetical protein